MAIGITKQSHDETISSPGIGHQPGPYPYRYKAWKRPQWLNHSNESAFVETLADPCDSEKSANANRGAWDCKEVCIELCVLISHGERNRAKSGAHCTETETSKSQC